MKLKLGNSLPSTLLLACLGAGVLLQSAKAVSLTWDPALTGPSTGPSGGTGTWTSSGTNTKNWYTGGADTFWTAGNDAVFAGVSGTVTLATASVAPNSITFATSGYTLVASSGTLLTTVGGLTTTAGTGTTTIASSIVFNLSGTARTYTIATGDTVDFQNIIRDSIAGTTIGLTKAGGGTMRLSAAASSGTSTTSSYRGTTTINAGTVQLGVANAINTSSGVSVAGGTLDLQTFNQTVTGAQLTAGTIIGTGTLTSTSTYDLQAGTVNAVLAGAVGMTKSGTGTVNLTASNAYTGVNTINGGVVNVTKDLALGAAPGAATTNIVMDGGTLQYGASFNINANRNIVLNAGGGTIDTNGVATFSAINNLISGTGALTKAGLGTLVLGAAGSKTYTGGTIITGGVLQFGVANVLPTTGNVTVNGGSLDVRQQTVVTSGTAILVTGTIDATTGVTGVLKANAFDVRSGVVNARLQDNAAGATLVKSTSGTVTFTNANTYTGATTISAGTLIVGVSGSGSITSAVTVTAGTLGGSGTTGAVTVGDGSGGHDAFIAPGNSPGTLATGSLNLLSDATFAFELNSNITPVADQIAVAGTVSIDSAAVFSFTDLGSGTLTQGTSFVIIANDSTDAISGAFANLGQGATFTSGANTYQASYLGGTGNDLTLTVVPEPGTCALLGLGGMALLWRARRRA